MEFKQDDSCSVQKSSCFLEIPFLNCTWQRVHFKTEATTGFYFCFKPFFRNALTCSISSWSGFLETIHAVVRLVVVPDTLPAFLSAVRLWKIPRIAKRPPACDSVIHNVVDLSQLPLFRFVIIMPQCFLVKLLRADYADRNSVPNSLKSVLPLCPPA